MSETFFPAGLIVDEPHINIEYMHYLSEKWNAKCEQTEKGLFSSSIFAVHTPNIQFVKLYYSHGLMRVAEHMRGTVSVSFVVDEASTLFQNSPLAVNDLTYTDDGVEKDLFSRAKSSGYLLIMNKAFFYSAFQRYFDVSVEEVVKNRRFTIALEKVPYFVQGLTNWMEYLKSETFQLTLVKDYDKIESEMMTHLFECILFESRHKEKMTFQANRVRDLLHANITESVTIEQLVKELGISGRQLHDRFKESYGLSPKKYLQNLRLNAVRKELLSTDPGSVSISKVAFKYGFTHMSHFSGLYQTMFGEKPSSTILHRIGRS